MLILWDLMMVNNYGIGKPWDNDGFPLDFIGWLPSGKRLPNYGKSRFEWQKSLFLWPVSIAMLNY